MSMLARENKGCAAGKADKVALAEVHDVLKRHYQVCVALCVDCVCVAGGGRLCWGKTRWCIFDGARRAQALLPSVCGCACVVCSWQLTRTGAERRATANSSMLMQNALTHSHSHTCNHHPPSCLCRPSPTMRRWAATTHTTCERSARLWDLRTAGLHAGLIACCCASLPHAANKRHILCKNIQKCNPAERLHLVPAAACTPPYKHLRDKHTFMPAPRSLP